MRISHVLAACAFLAAGCNSKQPQPPVQAALEPPKAVPDSSLERADKARIQGSENAKVWLVIASDFQCPVCREFHEDTYHRIVKDYVETGKIKFAYVNRPLAMHPHAVIAAEAAMCAAMQNRFWPMHDGLFATQTHWASADEPLPIFDSLATSLQLHMADWRACMTSHKAMPLIDADNARTAAGGAKGTPTFFIGNKLAVPGLAPYATYRAHLDAALAEAGPPSGGGRAP